MPFCELNLSLPSFHFASKKKPGRVSGGSSRNAVIQSPFALTFMALICICTGSVKSTTAQQAQPTLLLLKSGKVIEGIPVSRRDQVRVEFPGGDYIQIAAGRIEKQFKSRNNLYRYKSAVTDMTVAAQAELIQWYLDQKAYEMASKQITECLKNGLEIPAENWKQEVSRRASLTLPTKSVPANKPGKKTVDFSYQQFERRIEKHFVMGCGISGCHDSSTPNRFAVAFTFGKRQSVDQSRKNYDTVTELIARPPTDGISGTQLLLKNLTEKHGPLRSGVYSKRSTAYFDVLAWINRHEKLRAQSGAPMPSNHASVRIEPERSRPTGSSMPAEKRMPQSVPKLTGEKIASKVETTVNENPATTTPANATDSRRQPSLHDEPGQWKPRDEFDPEIFNRTNRASSVSRTKPVVTTTEKTNVPSRLTKIDESVASEKKN